nr:1-deoxy-D-xylulose-5-phosphate reductoisomerase [Peptostreptococcus faecalis]
MNINRKNISILGSTGSIGTQTLDIVRLNKDLFKIEGISTNKNIELLIDQIKEFNPKKVAIYDEIAFNNFLKLKEVNEYKNLLNGIEILKGLDGLVEISKSKNIDILVTAVVGMVGLLPTLAAIKNSTTIALANKETLVTAGEIVMSEAKKHNSNIIPVDSEHSAIFQCLNGENNNKIEKILLTASGGPFLGRKKEELECVTKNEALKHPNWTMGAKISIDSSTLMNKGLEVIEAKWLFDVDPKDIVVHVHPQSIVHSMVEFSDSTVMAQLGCPDMRVPIQYALTYPKRISSNFDRLNLFEASNLSFQEPDLEVFPCLRLAYEALSHGGTDCTVLNAANEVLVQYFLEEKIKFYDIPKYISLAIKEHSFIKKPTLEEILDIDKWTRDFISNTVLNVQKV